MKGKLIYLVFASLLGVLFGFGFYIIALVLFIVVSIFLYYFKSFSYQLISVFAGVFFLFSYRVDSEIKLAEQSHFQGNERQFLIKFGELIIDGDKLSSFVVEQNVNEKLAARYYIKTEKEQLLLTKKLRPGTTCTVTGNLEQPYPPTNENAFSYKKYLKMKKINWNLTIEKFNLHSCIIQTSYPLTQLQILRQNGIEYINNNFPKETAPLAIALIFGDRKSIDPNLLASYQELGIIHLLAISGLHVSMLFGMIFLVGIRIGITRERMTNGLIVSLPIYVILTGATPSVIRACMMMIMLLLMSKWKGKVINSLDLVSLAFLIYLLFSPLTLFEVGFQLSFCVTFALILSANKILRNNTSSVKTLFFISFISQLAAAPILLYNFFEISIISLAVNLLYVPLFSVFLLPVILLLFLLHLALQDLFNPVLTIINFFVSILNDWTNKLADIPLTTIVLGRPHYIFLILYIGAIIVFFTLWERVERTRDFLKYLLIPILIFFVHGASPYLSKHGEITFIDVGQGDSLLITMPYRKGVYLIDTGGTLRFPTEKWKERRKPFEVGRDVLVPVLKSKGISSIDKLILTHGDMDHIGGALTLLEEIKVKEIVLPAIVERSQLENDILTYAQNHSIPFKFVQDGVSWQNSYTHFSVISPSEKIGLDKNDGSIVLHVKLGGLNWLFTGDLEESGEIKLIKRYPKLEVDVLKVGHHGSKSSTTEALLHTYQPKLAIISVGRENRFGHPHREIINRLQEKGIYILRTDQNGAITYRFKKENGTFSTIFP